MAKKEAFGGDWSSAELTTSLAVNSAPASHLSEVWTVTWLHLKIPAVQQLTVE